VLSFVILVVVSGVLVSVILVLVLRVLVVVDADEGPYGCNGTWHPEPRPPHPNLASSLNSLVIAFCGLGRHDEELELRTEAVVRWRILARLDPDQHEDAYQREQDRLAGHFAKHDREPDEARRAEEDLAHRLGLET